MLTATQLIGHALRVYGEERGSVRIPAAVAAAMPSPGRECAEADRGAEEEEEEEDAGFMYLPLRATDPAESAAAVAAGLTAAVAVADPSASAAARAVEVGRHFGPERHVFWPADGF